MLIPVLTLLFVSAHGGVINKAVTADQVTTQLNELVLLDENGGDATEVVTNFQNMASGKYFDHDNAPLPLFTSVSDFVVNGVTFKAYDALEALYTEPNVDAADPNSDARVAAANSFIDALMQTKVMQTAWAFLAKGGLSSTDPTKFKQQLFDLWFTVYARGTAAGSSGFESAFVGETQNQDVINFAFWYKFYKLEKVNQLNYHGWFAREPGVQVEAQFEMGLYEGLRFGILLGTSPEFEFSAYTICALANLPECEYKKSGAGVVLQVKTLTVGSTVVIDSVYPIGGGGAAPTKKPTGAPHPADPKLQETVDAMRAADEDKPVNYKLNWGNPRAGSTDKSPDPLYTSLDETLFERPIYKALIDLYNNNVYDPDVCNAEGEITGNRKVYVDKVFDAFTSTKVFQIALKHLQDIGVAGDWETFKKDLWVLWFGRYSRCSGALGSSGWEHVFIGEWKGSKVDGQHCWVKYYYLEKAGDINYHGYIHFDDQLTGTFQYKWKTYLKNIGGFNTGTSPAFDFSLLSLCALTTSGSNACKFTIDGFPIAVTSYTQACGEGRCLSTAYPSDE